MNTIFAPRHGKALLSGLTYCGHCGARMNSTIHRKEYRRKRDGSLYRRDVRLYRCNASVEGEPTDCNGPRTYQAERVEAAVKTAISALLEQLEAKLQNEEQLRREIEIKQRKYCGLNQIFRSGTLEE